MRVFLTGGTGLLGRNTVTDLVQANHEVVALVRSADRARSLIAESVELVEGDLTKPESYVDHLKDIDAVIHAAACYGEFYRSSRSEAQLYDVNVKGTIALLEASREAGIHRIVYVSSAGVLATNDGTATNESLPYSSADDGPYFDSKIEAEKRALQFAKEHDDMHLVILQPTVMIGPNDTGPSPTGGVLKRVIDGELRILFPGAMNVVDARDVAAAAVEALTQGRLNARYLLGGSRHSVKYIFEKVSSAAGRPAPTKAPPAPMLKLMILLRGLAARLHGKRPQLRPGDIKRLQRNFWFDSSAANRDLNVRFRPVDQTLSDAAQWLLGQSTGKP